MCSIAAAHATRTPHSAPGDTVDMLRSVGLTPAEAVVAPGDACDVAAMLAPGGTADDMLWGCTAAKLAAVTLASIATNERFNITAPQPAGP